MNIESTEWSPEEVTLAVAVLEKISFCQERKRSMPVLVFEAHARSKKNVSTELVIFNEQGEVYLVERPGLKENSAEPYPGQLHVPGVTHFKNESLNDTFLRAGDEEGVTFGNVRVAEYCDVSDGARGRYVALIFVAEAAGIQSNPKGKFYPIEEIPWEKLMVHHREKIIPQAIEVWRRRNIR